jgi:NADH dehydrogenase
MVTPDYPEGHPMVAQPAIQQGKLLAKNIANLLCQRALDKFHYHDKGAMATIGRNHAVADVKLFNKEFRTQGFLAWLMWTFVHVISLVSFRNRLAVFISWTWSYFSLDKGLRFIIGNKREPIPVEETAPKELV